jgi:aryl-alcohol dehydrogenase-like predicted oxidoreductase
MQNLVNLLYREEEREMLPLCAAEGIGVIPWSPQARCKLSRDWDYTSIRTETDEAITRLFAKTEEADRSQSGGRGCQSPWHLARSSRARLAAGKAGDHRADRRRD